MAFNHTYKDKRVAVLGHTGFKGSWLTLWLKELGAEVWGFSDKELESPSHYSLLNLKKEIKDFRGDIKNYGELKKFFDEAKPHFVFHLAASAIVSECLEDPQSAFANNLMGTVNVMEALRHMPSLEVAIIVTTDKCYENLEWEFGYRENDRLGGKDPYSASKACAEIAFSSYFRTYFEKESKVKMATVRAGNVIGGGDWARDRIVSDLIRAWSNSSELKIRNPKATRPWQLVLEPLSGYLHLASLLARGREDLNGQSFNIGPRDEEERSVNDLVVEMQKYITKLRYGFEESFIAKKESFYLKLCCDKAKRHLSWEAILDFEETASFTASWYKAWQQGEDVMKLSLSQIKLYEQKAKERKSVWAST